MIIKDYAESCSERTGVKMMGYQYSEKYGIDIQEYINYYS